MDDILEEEKDKLGLIVIYFTTKIRKDKIIFYEEYNIGWRVDKLEKIKNIRIRIGLMYGMRLQVF